MSSSDYYKEYLSQRKTVNTLQNNIDTLTSIKNAISSDYFDEQRNVNQELNDLKEDMNKSVRHDSSWIAIASGCEIFKEKASSADPCLSSAINNIDWEIASLSSQKSTAETNRDTAYANYQSQKERERQEWLEKLKSLKKKK